MTKSRQNAASMIKGSFGIEPGSSPELVECFQYTVARRKSELFDIVFNKAHLASSRLVNAYS